jgi:hypothetical protein
VGVVGSDQLAVAFDGDPLPAGAADSVALVIGLEGQAMAKATVEVLIDDLDGSEATATVTIGWNGDWRELDLSKRNLASLSRTLDKYWKVGRPVSADRRPTTRRGRPKNASSPRPAANATRDPKMIRAWATQNGIAIPARGRIPADVERQYNEATRRS